MDAKTFNWLNTLPDWFREILRGMGFHEPAAIYWDPWLDRPVAVCPENTARLILPLQQAGRFTELVVAQRLEAAPKIHA
jgi:hypothetical protein